MNTARILVVDDEKVICAGLEKILGEAGYEVHTTLSAKRALEILKEGPVDIVITDLKMPEVSGMELLRIIREMYPHITVIVITGYSTVVVNKAVERRALLEETERGRKEIAKAQQIFENLPIGIIVLNRDKQIEYTNPSFMKMIESSENRSGMRGSTLSCLGNEDLIGILELQESVDRRICLPTHNLVVHVITVPLHGGEEWVGILIDISKSEQQREEILKLKRELLEKSQEVINKQMRVAQEIAGLLGETTAETKTTLLKLIALAKKEEAL
jgi:CheY-like chemotaxis protein